MHLEDPKNVHPFFNKPSSAHIVSNVKSGTNHCVEAQTAELPADDTVTNNDHPNDDQDYSVQNTSPKATKPRKKRTRKAVPSNNQPSLDDFARRKTDQLEVADVITVDEPVLEEDLNLDRRKRRKTASPKPSANAAHADRTAARTPSDLCPQLQAEAEFVRTQDVIDDVKVHTLVVCTPKDATLGSSPPNADSTREDAVPESSLPQAAEGRPRSATLPEVSEQATTSGNGNVPLESADNGTVRIAPKKQIKVTKTGKLVSSPPKKIEPSVPATPKRRGRPRKVTKYHNLSSTITVIRYGSDKSSRSALGQKIDAILNDGKFAEKHVSIAPTKPAGPPKAHHPFFTGKAGQKKAEEPTKSAVERRPVTPRKSACTPGKLRAERRKEQEEKEFPAFRISSNKSRQAKQSGLHEPSWPSKETAHVRNLQHESPEELLIQAPVASSTLRRAKLKRNAYLLSTEEEIVTRLARQLLKISEVPLDPDNKQFVPPADVRLPARLLTTGIDIQHMVRAQIRAPIETLAQRLYAKTHPAITTLFDDIEHTLTPFDEGRCEPQAWAQKYRPGRADHVLQTGTEAATLKDWLKGLTVMAVGAAQDSLKAKAPTDVKKPAKKKRKTAADDFIVFSDEEDEDEEMVELESNNNSFSRQQPSLRRPRWTRNMNVVLLSGPHGCGKSATVYAVAKELDFEVFELHSGVRRSGKDIQDKVGDMTANHLVNHQRSEAPIKPKIAAIVADNDTDNERDAAFQKDLDSGRQGTMMSFFTAEPTTKSKQEPKPKAQIIVQSPAKTRTIPAAQAMLPIAGTSRKSQKQSLILIEEADILFEEDQNFWAQIIKLAAQSKRPIVITCNNEQQIPTQALPMAAVLRLTAPPVDLATDYLVALAGREGHILQRQAVSDLYSSKNHDLRASIAELNFWCQMSVGDRKGGLEWIYQRWPPGKDVDANGRLLRVASEGTYHSGMGWLSHNIFKSENNVLFDKEEEILTEVWNDWGISPGRGDAANPLDYEPAYFEHTTQIPNLDALDRLVSLSDTLSAADVYSRIGLPSYDNKHDQPMDPTLPEMTLKERLSYTIDAPLLQVDPRTEFSNIDTALATTTHLLCCRAFPDLSSHHPPANTHHKFLEQAYTSRILHHKTILTTMPSSRSDFSSALDILATPPSAFNAFDLTIDNRSSYNLLATSLDRSFALITLDIAPYVRSIVAHELAVEAQRIRLGNLLSEGGRVKRGRTTRAARSAVEGGERQMKRRERWFHPDLNFDLVMQTAGSWAGMGRRSEGEESVTSTQQSESLAGTQRSEDLAGEQTGDAGQDLEMVVDADVE
ncbi:AAA family protein [Stagonosporopsis vannaccii]|nr:AAA family protein [Stagonosporopsis vannaccii]